LPSSVLNGLIIAYIELIGKVTSISLERGDLS
jgi:hypothetical protein